MAGLLVDRGCSCLPPGRRACGSDGGAVAAAAEGGGGGWGGASSGQAFGAGAGLGGGDRSAAGVGTVTGSRLCGAMMGVDGFVNAAQTAVARLGQPRAYAGGVA